MVDILLRKEEKDADKTKRFMKNVDELLRGCESAISCLTELKQRTGTEIDDEKKERIKDIDDALASCKAIKEQIKKSINVELKFAVAASKKAGKSVIVNCFLGEQIAPTSTELATPNNCFYKKSHDNMYHLRLEGSEVQDFASCEEIYAVSIFLSILFSTQRVQMQQELSMLMWLKKLCKCVMLQYLQ